MSGFFPVDGFKGRVGKFIKQRADIWFLKHGCAHPFLGHRLLLLQRRRAALVGQADLPGLAGRLLGGSGKVARKFGAEGLQRLQHHFAGREADQPDMVAELDAEQLLALFLDRIDQRGKVQRQAGLGLGRRSGGAAMA